MNAIPGRIAPAPLLSVEGLTKWYGHVLGCRDVAFDLRPGEVLGIVGESGSGKTTLLNCISGKLTPTSGEVRFDTRRFGLTDIYGLSEPDRRRMQREEWGFVHQNPRDGLRMRVSGGANVAEPLMNLGGRHYGNMRQATIDWLDRVELDTRRIDDKPRNFSGGMQQRIQVARYLIHGPRLVFMDEPTCGLDVSVQARLLDLLREL
ncbi:MAG: ATP-binding cassette domain-containing protein, partial [Phenylobacterium sp.]|nr:ATP-binding cassette domain-containing protein [Phenylobacterium sp.]